jgi:hypothetical protein
MMFQGRLTWDGIRAGRGRTLALLAVAASLLAGCGGPILDTASAEYSSFLRDILPPGRQPVGDTRGTAIMDPLALRELDTRERLIGNVGQIGFSVGRMLNPAKPGDAPLSNEELFALPSMTAVRRSLDQEFSRYNVGREGAPADRLSMFNIADFYAKNSRFVLAGVVNRMDRAYLSPSNCGEIRFLYRLTREPSASEEKTTDNSISSATLNIVMKAKSHLQKGELGCSEIARRWLAVADPSLTGAELATKLMSKGGPLELVTAANIDRIELNIQVAHARKPMLGEARADYLLKVFHYNSRSKKFEDGPMENQLDRERILASDDLKRDFRRWLLEPNEMGELDKGTILIPERFLANSVVAATPAERSNLGPAVGFVESDDSNGAVFKESDIVAALKRAVDTGISLQNIHSVDNFKQRLNDVTCSGCHQTRGIGGFHFPGGDWTAAKPLTTAQASSHFFGDQLRRRAIVMALRDGRRPDYSRGFSDTLKVVSDKEFAESENGK